MKREIYAVRPFLVEIFLRRQPLGVETAVLVNVEAADQEE